jgi:hypothetical protein
MKLVVCLSWQVDLGITRFILFLIQRTYAATALVMVVVALTPPRSVATVVSVELTPVGLPPASASYNQTTDRYTNLSKVVVSASVLAMLYTAQTTETCGQDKKTCLVVRIVVVIMLLLAGTVCLYFSPQTLAAYAVPPRPPRRLRS